MSFVQQNALEKDTSSEAPEAEKANVEDTPSEKSEGENATQSSGFEKRYKDLQSYHTKTVNEKNELISSLQKELAQKNSVDDTLSKEKLVSFMKKQPELYEVIVQIATEGTNKASQELRDKLSEIEKITHDAAAKVGFKELLEIHPDANEIKSDPEFLIWVKRQSPKIQNILTGNDSTVEEIAFAIDKYKTDTGIVKKKKQSQKEGAQAVTSANVPETGKQKKIWSESEISKLTQEEWVKYADEIKEASKNNDIILDISKGR